MKKKPSLFEPIFWTIIGCMCILIIFVDLFYPPYSTLLMILHGLNALLGVVNMVNRWMRYKKDKAKEETTDIDNVNSL